MKSVIDDLLAQAKANPVIQQQVQQVMRIRQLYQLFEQCKQCSRTFQEQWEHYPLLCKQCEVMKEITEKLES